MSNKRLAAILGGCIALIIAVVAIASLPPASGEPGENTTFHINVIPETPVQTNGDSVLKYSIVGQHFVFLVTITDEGQESELPVRISAKARGAEVVIYHEDIFEGEVAEVVVIPAPASIGKTIKVTITGTRGSTSDEKVSSFEVAEGEDDRQEYAGELLDRFVSWLATNHPELGITEDTAWNGTMVSPVWLVVSHYLFFSEEWEVHISWHIMVPPYDWAKIDLRHRFDELVPSYAFEISSVDASSEPVPTEVPETVWR
jgi:energy-converting hydrogenase Eha subunit A